MRISVYNIHIVNHERVVSRSNMFNGNFFDVRAYSNHGNGKRISQLLKRRLGTDRRRFNWLEGIVAKAVLRNPNFTHINDRSATSSLYHKDDWYL